MKKRSNRSKSAPRGTGEIIREAQPIRRLEPHAAGLDVGAKEIAACVSDSAGKQIVRMFGTYTRALHELADWLAQHGVTSVAMESTGVYWIPVFELLETRGFVCHLISSADLRRHPSRKSDVLDCQWIQTLHAHGLLAESFRPDADLIALRTLLRHRAQLIEHRAPHIQHMQKALTQMNIQLKQALSDVTGETGQRILRAIVAGERDPRKLAALRNYRCKQDEDEIAKALTGTLRQAQGRPGAKSISSSSSNRWRCTTSTPARLPNATRRSSGCTKRYVRRRKKKSCRRWRNRRRVTARTRRATRRISASICTVSPKWIWRRSPG